MSDTNLTIILGAPRSGTTWLGKIFDSHPQVFYRHEPDLAAGSEPLPPYCPSNITQQDFEIAHRFVQHLPYERSLKAACSLPVFKKHQDDCLSYAARASAVMLLKLAGKILPRRHHAMLRLPGGLDQPHGPRSHIVIKSVTSLGRANLFATALPRARFILIIRNALGQVASRLQGIRTGLMPDPGVDPALLRTPVAQSQNLTTCCLHAMPLAQRLAWEWALQNEKALSDISELPRTKVVRYVDMVRDPASQAREILKFSGLSWEPGVAAFIRKSTEYKGHSRYFQVMQDRHTLLTQPRWTLSPPERDQVLAVMRATNVGQLWPELLN